MLDQTISKSSLRSHCSAADIYNFKLGWSLDEQLDSLEGIANNINSNEFKFSNFKSFSRNGKVVYKPVKAEDYFAVKIANHHLKKIFSVKQSDRQTLVKQLKILLQENTPFKLVKIDIKSFYESIPVEKVLKSCWDDPILSYKTKEIIQLLFNTEQFKKANGLPRGLSISSTLSEYYLKDLDKFIRELSGVYYSARYVDDIIVLCTPSEMDHKEKIIEFIKGIELKINEFKTKQLNNKVGIEPFIVEFLGYQFKNEGRNVNVTIAEKKIKKIKTRITLAFISFSKSKNYNLLEKRIKFLTGNFKLESRSKVSGDSLKGGIFYNFSEIPENCKSLIELDDYLKRITLSKKGALGEKINSLLNNSIRRKLLRHSFQKGFKNRVCHNFNYKEVAEIKACWINE